MKFFYVKLWTLNSEKKENSNIECMETPTEITWKINKLKIIIIITSDELSDWWGLLSGKQLEKSNMLLPKLVVVIQDLGDEVGKSWFHWDFGPGISSWFPLVAPLYAYWSGLLTDLSSQFSIFLDWAAIEYVYLSSSESPDLHGRISREKV